MVAEEISPVTANFLSNNARGLRSGNRRLDQKTQAIRLATFCSLMGKGCLQICLNLNFGTEEIMITSSLSALEDYFLPKRNLVYERYVCFQFLYSNT